MNDISLIPQFAVVIAESEYIFILTLTKSVGALTVNVCTSQSAAEVLANVLAVNILAYVSVSPS